MRTLPTVPIRLRSAEDARATAELAAELVVDLDANERLQMADQFEQLSCVIRRRVAGTASPNQKN